MSPCGYHGKLWSTCTGICRAVGYRNVKAVYCPWNVNQLVIGNREGDRSPDYSTLMRNITAQKRKYCDFEAPRNSSSFLIRYFLWLCMKVFQISIPARVSNYLNSLMAPIACLEPTNNHFYINLLFSTDNLVVYFY